MSASALIKLMKENAKRGYSLLTNPLRAGGREYICSGFCKVKPILLPVFRFPLLLLWGAGVVFFLAVNSSCSHNEPVDFNADIRPIINTKCISCHGGVKKNGGFSLLFREEALAETESGQPAIIPGKPGESEFIKRLVHDDPEYRMPLDAPPLSDEEIRKLKAWIRQGAQWEDHWAYIKPKPVTLPQVSNTTWPANGIDHFILKKLEEEGLQPSPEADKTTLLRRVSLDLTGLPPTQVQLDSFLQDNSANAYEKVVDRLLASPHYGERWTAMWLDLARYADTKGYEKDGFRNIWRYRDYVIESFNEDKPFNQFTVEQLAGDLLPEPTEKQLIATGFHRNTTNNDEGGTDDEEFRTTAVIDRVNTTWEVWQATTMSCVQCHSHPYDPFRQEEYYQFMSFFNNTRDEDTPNEAPTLTLFSPDDVQQVNKIKDWIQAYAPEKEKKAQVNQFVQLLKTAEPKVHPHDFDSLVQTALSDGKYLAADHNGFARIQNVNLTGKTQLLISYAARSKNATIDIRKGSLDGECIGTIQLVQNGGGWSFAVRKYTLQPVEGKHDLYFIFKDPQAQGVICTLEWLIFAQPLPGAGKPGFEEIEHQFVRLLNPPDSLKTPVLIENTEEFERKTHVFVRGNWLVKGKEVQSGVPASMNPMPANVPGNRLGMARWLVNPENPLTARVAVNRFWEQLFGTGIVETLEDFGSQGMKPSHPELLDWLALQFMQEQQWSVKKMLKQMVMSATYRQSSKVTPELQEKDLFNRFMARGPRVRLTAEQVRDQALAVGGLLSHKIGGPSVMPPQPAGVWQVVYSGMQWKTSQGEDAFRRGIYTFWRRSVPYPSMVTFDSPVREICVSRRIRTNTPLQALVTLNDTVYIVAARGLASQMLSGNNTVDEQLKTGYKLATLREPGAAKLEILKDLYTKSVAYYKEKPEQIAEITGEEKSTDTQLAALTVVSNAILNLDEVITKE
jgi:cytochrome c1